MPKSKTHTARRKKARVRRILRPQERIYKMRKAIEDARLKQQEMILERMRQENAISEEE